ncbi:MAG: hypothetical protein ABR510_04565 [Trueperaceae bacterium]
MRAVAATVAVLALTCASWAAAWDLRVDPSGGPLVLIDHVEAVLADWSAAGADVEGTDRTVVVRYGDPDRLGPDAIVLVVVRPDAGSYDVLVHPNRDGVRAALVPAFGVVLGGVPGVGALDPRIDGVAPRVPSTVDVAALRAARPDVPGDLDGDGRVDFEDLLRLAAAYGRQGINLPEDLDGDGVVSNADLDLLRERYTFETAPSTGDAPAEGTAPMEDTEPGVPAQPIAPPAEGAEPTPPAQPNDAPAEDAEPTPPAQPNEAPAEDAEPTDPSDPPD